MMKLTQRSYTNGKVFRPKPVIVERPNSNLLVIATPWGPEHSAEQVCEIFISRFESLIVANDIFPYRGQVLNRMVAAVQKANLELGRSENERRLTTIVEFSAFHYQQGILNWIHVGSPHIFVRQSEEVHPLAFEPDWATTQPGAPPLLRYGLGVGSELKMHSGTLRLTPQDQLLLLARSAVPSVLYSPRPHGIDRLAHRLVRNNAELPFWIATLELDPPEVESSPDSENGDENSAA